MCKLLAKVNNSIKKKGCVAYWRAETLLRISQKYIRATKQPTTVICFASYTYLEVTYQFSYWRFVALIMLFFQYLAKFCFFFSCNILWKRSTLLLLNKTSKTVWLFCLLSWNVADWLWIDWCFDGQSSDGQIFFIDSTMLLLII